MSRLRELQSRNAGLLLVLVVLVLVHAALYRSSDPFFNVDEARHLMTGVFFRDFLVDLPLTHPRDYAVEYYVQYPALGLLVWPPLFHFSEGAVMLVFGTSIVVGKLLVAIGAAVSCVYLYRLVCRTHGTRVAVLSTLLLGLAPLFFNYSRYVMLEVPTLACCLVAIFHFLRYLDDARPRDIFIAAGAAAAAALTRFDAAYLLVYFAIVLTFRREWKILARGKVLLAAGLALLAVLPVYWLIADELGPLHVRQAEESVMPGSHRFMAAKNFLYYPAELPGQVGWALAAAFVLGLATSLTTDGRKANGPYLAMIAATYLVFTPLAETLSRHSIYWIPGVVVVAAGGIEWVQRRVPIRGTWTVLASLVVLATLAQTIAGGTKTLRGCEPAVRYVLENSQDRAFCLYDGRMDGTFTFLLRHEDDGRSRGVLRGDKLLYTYLNVPQVDYREHVKEDADILEMIYQFDPEFIVVEDPLPSARLKTASRLRKILRERAEKFRLERTIPMRWDNTIPLLGTDTYRECDLKIYRNLDRNPQPETRFKFDMLLLQREIEANVVRERTKVEADER